MRVTHVSTKDTQGGAAKAAYRLHRALLAAGVDSTMCVSVKHSDDPSVLELDRRPPLRPATAGYYLKYARIRLSNWRYRHHPADFEIFSDDRSPYGHECLGRFPAADVVNLHWIADFIDYREMLLPLSRRSPLVWRLSDMNPFTGGCHYDRWCGRYVEGCGSCPQLASSRYGDLSSKSWQRKQAVFDRITPDRLHVVALNRWMADQVAKSPLLGRFPLTVIPNGVDLQLFKPESVHVARRELGVPVEAFILLFVADDVGNARKGFKEVQRALARVAADRPVLLMSVGKNVPQAMPGHVHRHLGFISDPSELRRIYSAADLYVMPSLQDNQPNTVLESMACGTPVVAFDTGGIPEMVEDGVTGLLAPVGNSIDMAQAILQLADAPETREIMSGNCCRRAKKEFSRELQTQRYINLYNELIT